PAADDQILPTVSVHVMPPHPGPQLTELLRQQRLPLKIIKLLLRMHVMNQPAHILKYRLRFGVGSWKLEVGSFFGPWSLGFEAFRFHSRLLDLVKPVGLHGVDHTAPAA